MKKISLKSWLFAVIFVLAVMAIGITGTLGVNLINPGLVYTTILAIGFGVVVNSITIDKKGDSVIIQKTEETKKQQEINEEIPAMKKEEESVDIPPLEKEEPLVMLDQKEQALFKFIYDHLQSGFDINTIGRHLVKAGYDNLSINKVLKYMVDNNIIDVPKEEEKTKEVKSPEEITEELDEELDVPPEPPKSKTVKKAGRPKEKKVEGGVSCPKCGKNFDSDRKMKRHYGMAHFSELDI